MAGREHDGEGLLAVGGRTPRPLPSVSDATLRDSAHMAGVEFGAEAHGLHRRAAGQDRRRAGRGRHGLRLEVRRHPHDRGRARGGRPGQVPHAGGGARPPAGGQGTGRGQAPGRPVGHAVDPDVGRARRAQTRVAEHQVPHRGGERRHRQAKERGFHVTFSGEDGARTERERLVSYVAAGFGAGADRFRLAETVAYLAPWQMYDVISDLTAIDGAEIEIHSHNMLGMAAPIRWPPTKRVPSGSRPPRAASASAAATPRWPRC